MPVSEMNDITHRDRTEKIFGEVLAAVDAGCYRKIGVSDILVDLGEPRGCVRIDKLTFAEELADNEELYRKFLGKASAADKRN